MARAWLLQVASMPILHSVVQKPDFYRARRASGIWGKARSGVGPFRASIKKAFFLSNKCADFLLYHYHSKSILLLYTPKYSTCALIYLLHYLILIWINFFEFIWGLVFIYLVYVLLLIRSVKLPLIKLCWTSEIKHSFSGNWQLQWMSCTSDKRH